MQKNKLGWLLQTEPYPLETGLNRLNTEQEPRNDEMPPQITPEMDNLTNLLSFNGLVRISGEIAYLNDINCLLRCSLQQSVH